MDENKELSDKLVHLARLALASRTQDVELFLRRLARKHRLDSPELSSALGDLLRSAPTRQSPLRQEEGKPLPVDLETRLQLVRVEQPDTMELEPVWTKEISESLGQLLVERAREGDLERAGLSCTRTVLFTGAPGVGKTLAARWLAEKLGMPLLVLDLSAVMSSFLGRTGTNLRAVLDYAKGVHGVLLLDELDSIAKKRDDATDIGELKRLVTVLLQEIDDWPDGRILLAATNHPTLLDPAVWRRFELVVEFPMPGPVQIREAIKRFMGPAELKDHLVEALAIAFSGLSYSDIQRDIARLRRGAVLAARSFGESVQDLVKDRASSLPRRNRADLAKELMRGGLSQRRAHELTGVSRDTLRKATRSTQGEEQ